MLTWKETFMWLSFKTGFPKGSLVIELVFAKLMCVDISRPIGFLIYLRVVEEVISNTINTSTSKRYDTCLVNLRNGLYITNRLSNSDRFEILFCAANLTNDHIELMHVERMNGEEYPRNIRHPHVRLWRATVEEPFVFMDDSARTHRTMALR